MTNTTTTSALTETVQYSKPFQKSSVTTQILITSLKIYSSTNTANDTETQSQSKQAINYYYVLLRCGINCVVSG